MTLIAFMARSFALSGWISPRVSYHTRHVRMGEPIFNESGLSRDVVSSHLNLKSGDGNGLYDVAGRGRTRAAHPPSWRDRGADPHAPGRHRHSAIHGQFQGGEPRGVQQSYSPI